MKKDKYFRVFGIYYFLLHLPEKRTIIIRGEEISSDTKLGNKVNNTNLKHFKGFEIKKPNEELINLINCLKQKAIDGELSYYTPKKEVESNFARHQRELIEAFWKALEKEQPKSFVWHN